MESLSYAILGFAPGLFWVWFFRRKDTLDPAPAAAVLWAFALGGVATLGIFGLRPLVEGIVPATPSALGHQVVDAFWVTAPLEEGLKAAAFGVVCSLRWPGRSNPMDPLLYGVAVGLGFASVENVHFLLQTQDPWLAVMRGFTATLLHAATTGSLGFFVAAAGLGAPAPRWLLWALGGSLAWLSHGAYTLGLLVGGWAGLVALLFVLPGMLVLMALRFRWAAAAAGDGRDPPPPDRHRP